MGSSGHPFVPVLVHEVGDDATSCLGQVGVFVGCAGYGLYLAHEQYLALVRREGKAFDISIVVGELLTARTIGIHLPDLTATTLATEETQLTVFGPYHIALALGGVGNLLVVTAVGIHDEHFGIALVLWHAVVAHGISHFRSIWRDSHSANASHRPQGFWGHTLIADIQLGGATNKFVVGLTSWLCATVAGGQCQCC